MICLVNGKIKNKISILDRGLQFGDGCFTTIRVVKNQVALLEYHIHRLQKCAKKLFLPYINWKNVILDIKTLALLNNKELAVIKVIITRGSGYSRGYSTIGTNKPSIIIFLTNYPINYINKKKSGIELMVSTLPINNHSYHLSGIKHLNCLEYILIKKQIETTKVDEALITDTNNNIIGCCTGNIFWRKYNNIYTPDLNHIGIKGIMRKKIIKCLNDSHFKLYFTKTNINILKNCDEILVSNSLMPVLSVNIIKINTKNIIYYNKSKKLFNFIQPYCLMLN